MCTLVQSKTILFQILVRQRIHRIDTDQNESLPTRFPITNLTEIRCIISEFRYLQERRTENLDRASGIFPFVTWSRAVLRSSVLPRLVQPLNTAYSPSHIVFLRCLILSYFLQNTLSTDTGNGNEVKIFRGTN